MFPLRLVEQAAKELQQVGIDCEVIDIQSLIHFINHDLVKSSKTNRLLVIDEDVPGGRLIFYNKL
jgi:pyruvate/2-oxoglutarate/acetoin dehydrogenase E1 component